MATWFYEEHGRSVGPVEESELMGKLRSGQVPPNTMVWQEGLADWQEAMTVFPGLSTARAATANPYHPSQTGPAHPYRPASPPGIATTSMVLGICAVVLGLMTCFLGILCGIPAVICGHKAMSQIKAENLPGHGIAMTGLITGYISIVGSILGILFIVVMLMIPGVDPNNVVP